MAAGSKPGERRGGRAPGVANRQTADIAEKLAALDCDPIKGMAGIAMNEKNPVDIRARMYAELAQYIAPKRKSIEHSAGAGASMMGLILMPPKEAVGQ